MLAADVCASKIHTHPDYNRLAARLLVSNLHKQTHPLFSETTEALHREGLAVVHLRRQGDDLLELYRRYVPEVTDVR